MPMPLEPPKIGDDMLLARYGFLPQSTHYVRELLLKNDITIEQLINAAWLEDIRSRGRIRLVESILHKGGIDAVTNIDLSTDIGKMTEALSFLHAMLVVCASFDERLLARWIEGESSRADQLLGMDKENFLIVANSYLSGIREEEIPGSCLLYTSDAADE